MKKTNKRKPFGPISFIRSDRVKVKRDVTYLLETFTHEYIEPSLRGKNKRRKLRFLKSVMNYILETYGVVRYEEQVRMMKVICDACKDNINAKLHGKRYIHSDGYGICKAWRIRNFMKNKRNHETRRLMLKMINNNMPGHSIQGLTNRLKKGKII